MVVMYLTLRMGFVVSKSGVADCCLHPVRAREKTNKAIYFTGQSGVMVLRSSIANRIPFNYSIIITMKQVAKGRL